MPINKWINLTFRLQNKSVDVYVNGLLTKRHELSAPQTKMERFGAVKMVDLVDI